MSSVYSGGLVYEYSEEGSKYGLVTISGSTVTTNDDFTNLVSAFKATANPSGDGGYNSTGGASNCPAKSTNWPVDSDALPAIPKAAAAVRFPSHLSTRSPPFSPPPSFSLSLLSRILLKSSREQN